MIAHAYLPEMTQAMNAQLNTLKQKTLQINTEIYGLYLSYRDPHASWYVRLLLAFVIGYGLSPIDLVPDLVAIFGFLDDVVVLTLGTSISYQLILRSVKTESRLQAYNSIHNNDEGSAHAYEVISYAWLIAFTLMGLMCYKLLFTGML